MDVEVDEIGHGGPIYRGGPTAQPAGIFSDLLDHAAVHDVARAGHVGGLVGAEPGDESGHFLGFSGPAERHLGVERPGVLNVSSRRDHAGRDRVDADLVLGQLEREPSGEHAERGLGGGVDGEVGARNVLVHGGDVDDRAAVAHSSRGSLCEQEARADVDREGEVEVGGGEVEERFRGHDAGVLDEHVDAAELRDGLGDEALRPVGVGQVAVDPQAISPCSSSSGPFDCSSMVA